MPCIIQHIDVTTVYILLVFHFLESNGGSVEGYCAGEKDMLDTFNKWVRHFSFNFFGTTVCAGVTVLEFRLNHQNSCKSAQQLFLSSYKL